MSRAKQVALDALRNGARGKPVEEHPECERGDSWEGEQEQQSRESSGQHPSGEKPASEPWEDPIPLAEIPPVDAFPADVFPAQLVAFGNDAAGALACPPDYLYVPMLVLAGAAIGSSRAIEVKAGWRERPNVYAAVVGPPGSVKSPALKLVAAPVYAEQGRRMANYRRAKVAFEEAGDGSLPAPTLSTIYASDITTEALAKVLQDNARGVSLIRDELTSWIGGMDQYRAKGRGSDRQFYLSAWAGEPVSVHRRNQDDGPLFVPHPFIAVVGGIPPDLLSRLRGDREVADGFLDRILFAYPAPAPTVGESWACVSDDAQRAWSDVLSWLWALNQESDGEGGHRPCLVRLDASGRAAWEKFTHRLAGEMNSDGFPDCLRGPWSKMRGYCARLALVIQLLRLACREVDTEDVDGNSIGRASWVVRYFMSHARKVYCAIDADKDVERAKRLLTWITREQRSEFKRWEPFEDLKNLGQFPKVECLDEPLSRLTKHRCIRPKATPPRQGPGRPPAAVYEVNPCVIRHPANPANPGK